MLSGREDKAMGGRSLPARISHTLPIMARSRAENMTLASTSDLASWEWVVPHEIGGARGAGPNRSARFDSENGSFGSASLRFQDAETVDASAHQPHRLSRAYVNTSRRTSGPFRRR